MIDNFDQISIETLNSLSFSHLITIFSSPNLKYQDEDSYFLKILNLIQKEQQNVFLLKYVEFEFVSSSNLKQLFQHIFFNQLPIEVSKQMEKRFLCEILKPPLPSPNRWISQPNGFVFSEIEEITNHLKRFTSTNSAYILQNPELSKPFTTNQKVYN